MSSRTTCDWIVGFTSKEAQVYPILTEIRAFIQGLLCLWESRIHPLDINIDSSEVINLFEHENNPYSNLILECMSIISKQGAIMPTHIFREQNKVADLLNKEGLRNNNYGNPTFLIVPSLYAKAHFRNYVS